MTPEYIATIPGRHHSEHRSEAAAIRAIRKAEATHKFNGTVQRVVESGHFRSVTTVYGFFDVGHAAR